MGTPTISTKFAADGEKEYREAIKSINSDLKVLNSETKMVSEQFKGNEKSTEALTSKHKTLEKQLSAQKDKVEYLKKALESAKSSTEVNEKAVKNWQTQLNNAQAEVFKTENALKNLTVTQDENSEKTTGLGDAVDKLGSKYGINLPDGMKKSLNGLTNVNTGMVVAAAGAAALVAALVEVEQAFIDVTKEAAAYADEIATTADITGISAKALQEYNYAAELMDVSVETITGSQTKLIRNMQNAAEGTEAQVAAFEKLGVQYTNTDGSLRDSEETFWAVIDALGGVSNETERDVIAMDLMGKSAQDLNPLIKKGSETMEAYAKEAENMGYVLDDEALGALTDVDDAFQRMDKTVEAAKNQIAVQFAPSLENATEKGTEFIQKVSDTFTKTGITSAFGSLLDSASDLLEPLGNIIEMLGPAAAATMKGTALVFATIADTLSVIHGVLTLNADEIDTAMGGGINSGRLSATQKILYDEFYNSSVYNSSTGQWTSSYKTESGIEATAAAPRQTTINYDASTGETIVLDPDGKILNFTGNASGTDNWRGGMTWVGENGPELVNLPQGTQILNAQESRNSSGGDVYNITIDAASVQEFEDIVRLVKNQKRLLRMGV